MSTIILTFLYFFNITPTKVQLLCQHLSTVFIHFFNYYLNMFCQYIFIHFFNSYLYSTTVKCQPFFHTLFIFFQHIMSTTIQYTLSTKCQPLFTHLTRILHSTLLTHLITFVNPFSFT